MQKTAYLGSRHRAAARSGDTVPGRDAALLGPWCGSPCERREAYETLRTRVEAAGCAAVIAVKNGVNGRRPSRHQRDHHVQPFMTTLMNDTCAEVYGGLVSVKSAYSEAEIPFQIRIRLAYDDRRLRRTLRAFERQQGIPPHLREYATLFGGFLAYVSAMRDLPWQGMVAQHLLNPEKRERRKVRHLWDEYRQRSRTDKRYGKIIPLLKGHLLELDTALLIAGSLPERSLFWRWPVQTVSWEQATGSGQSIATMNERQLEGMLQGERKKSIDYPLAEIVIAASRGAIMTALEEMKPQTLNMTLDRALQRTGRGEKRRRQAA